MLLKALLSALMVFAGSVGVLRVSVLYENYALLVAGLVMAIGAVALGLQKEGRAARF